MSLGGYRPGSSHCSERRQLFPFVGTSVECDLASLRSAGREYTFGFNTLKGKEIGGERIVFLGTSFGFVCVEVVFFANVKLISIVELRSATGIMPPKPLMRREQLEGSAAGSDSFEHMARSAREHSVPLSEPRMMWGSDPYPHAESQQSTSPPKVLEEPDDLR